MRYIIVAESATSALELISAARDQRAEEIIAVLFAEEDAQKVASSGVSSVLCVDLANGALLEAVGDQVVMLAREAGEAVVLLAATRQCVNLSARIAQALGTAPVVDVRCLGAEGAEHMVYGGALAVVDKPVGPYYVYVVSGGSYEAAELTGAPCAVTTISIDPEPGVRVRGLKARETVSTDLSSAKRIVCIGRGVADQAQFSLCSDLAKALGAEMGCSRPVTETVDPLMARDLYIGASGKSVKPELFIGLAVSGQTQFLMGMYESKKVVAVNKSKDALLFDECDYGIVGEVEEIVPALIAALNA